MDTTATEADVRYPTDPGLCAHAVSRLGSAVTRVKAAGLAPRTRFRNRRRKAGKIIREVSEALSGRPQDRRPMIEKLTGEVHRLVELRRERHRPSFAMPAAPLRGHPTGEKQLLSLEREMALAQRTIDQTALRLSGERTMPTG